MRKLKIQAESKLKRTLKPSQSSMLKMREEDKVKKPIAKIWPGLKLLETEGLKIKLDKREGNIAIVDYFFDIFNSVKDAVESFKTPVTYFGSSKAKRFHKGTCSFLKRIKNVRTLTKWEAFQRHACKRCIGN